MASATSECSTSQEGECSGKSTTTTVTFALAPTTPPIRALRPAFSRSCWLPNTDIDIARVGQKAGAGEYRGFTGLKFAAQ